MGILEFIEKATELRIRKYPNEHDAAEKAFSAWWASLSGRDKSDPDSYRTSAYPAHIAATEALYTLLYADEEFKALKAQYTPDH